MFAPAQKLDNVIVMIDYNKWQATGRSDEIMALAPLREKWQAFGWDASEVDGHNMESLVETLRQKPDGTGRPRAIIAHTVKGKGVSFMEDDNNWHYRIPTADEVQQARKELGQPQEHMGTNP
jgi:transketolase